MHLGYIRGGGLGLLVAAVAALGLRVNTAWIVLGGALAGVASISSGSFDKGTGSAYNR